MVQSNHSKALPMFTARIIRAFARTVPGVAEDAVPGPCGVSLGGGDEVISRTPWGDSVDGWPGEAHRDRLPVLVLYGAGVQRFRPGRGVGHRATRGEERGTHVYGVNHNLGRLADEVNQSFEWPLASCRLPHCHRSAYSPGAPGLRALAIRPNGSTS